MDEPIVFVKDPQAILDYSVDWTLWLDDDTISASAWVVSAGLVVTSQVETTKVATVWISSGTAGQTYSVTNRITTASGRVDERTFSIIVRHK